MPIQCSRQIFCLHVMLVINVVAISADGIIVNKSGPFGGNNRMARQDPVDPGVATIEGIGTLISTVFTGLAEIPASFAGNLGNVVASNVKDQQATKPQQSSSSLASRPAQIQTIVAPNQFQGYYPQNQQYGSYYPLQGQYYQPQQQQQSQVSVNPNGDIVVQLGPPLTPQQQLLMQLLEENQQQLRETTTTTTTTTEEPTTTTTTTEKTDTGSGGDEDGEDGGGEDSDV